MHTHAGNLAEELGVLSQAGILRKAVPGSDSPGEAAPGDRARLSEPESHRRAGAQVVAFTGAGGKTSAMFATALCALAFRTIATTTTMIRDPRQEAGRRFDEVLIDPRFGEPTVPAKRMSERVALGRMPRRGAGPLVVASGALPESGKLRGVHPSHIELLRGLCELLLVEADGARGLSVKAPSPSEPVIPDCADTVVGLIGLDCLGSPMDARMVHRPELFGALTGCAEGEPIGAIHLARLIRAPSGLFKGCPPGARRVVLLNKNDSAPPGAVRELLDILAASSEKTLSGENFTPQVSSSSAATRVLLCSLRHGRVVGRLDTEGGGGGMRNAAGALVI